MCTGTSLLYKIPRVVVGENVTFTSTGENLFPENNVEVVLLQDQRCIQVRIGLAKSFEMKNG
jgi:creatinine deaminase